LSAAIVSNQRPPVGTRCATGDFADGMSEPLWQSVPNQICASDQPPGTDALPTNSQIGLASAERSDSRPAPLRSRPRCGRRRRARSRATAWRVIGEDDEPRLRVPGPS